MTVTERIETQSFAYDAEFPPDVAEGQPLTVVARHRHSEQPAYKRALRVCVRVVARHR